ncbi:MAG: bifunctional folylpolyglutamate synthase/dihydrofolate synthase [Blastocatellia bacterium]|nr:bifunctional folylpolyglutamate synthase/dihydrofolate synthase [Blastocatellia bacterium]MDW8167667.1 folylpolyglutamate synthase/dihydrofolate synthase family protein [Acidobacteriota bacterium]
MNYRETLAYLEWLGHETLRARFGLEKIRRLLAELGDPHTAYPSIIIAGTNGKGSTAAMVDAILRQAGLRTGLYTSPHLVRVEERIRVLGREITPEEFAAIATRVRAVSEELLQRGEIEARPTYFEFVTAIGFEYFREKAIEIAVLEVGLGGRLDATNVVPPFLSLVTSIDIDHEQYLGSTIASIAREKAMIIKPGSRVVLSRQHPEAREVLLARCQECQVTPIWAEEAVEILECEPDGRFAFAYRSASGARRSVRLSLRGRHQIENALVAIRAAEVLRTMGYSIPDDAIGRGLEVVEWPGRLEVVGPSSPLLVLDGAHNTAGARVVRAYLEEFGRRPLTLVFGTMRDKRIAEMAAALFPLADLLILTRVPDERAAPLELLLEQTADLRCQLGRPTEAVEPVEVAFDRARERTPPSGMICVTGSLYLVGEAKRWLARSHGEGGARD